MFSFFPVSDDLHKGFHIGVFFEETKQLDQEKTDRVISESYKLVFMGDDGSDKGEVYEGTDESGKPADDAAIGVDFNIAPLVCIVREPKDPGFGERTIILAINLQVYSVEFFDDAAQVKGSEISQLKNTLV